MPLDDYIPDYWHLVDYAQDLAMKPCMTSAGYQWDVPWQDVDGGNGPSMNAAQRKLFNPELAKQWGYHEAPKDDPSAPAWRIFATQASSLTQAEHDKLYSCLDEVRKKELPDLPASIQLPNSLEQAAYEAALQASPTLKAAEKWEECMQPAGVSDLPGSPDQMPSQSLRTQFGLNDVNTDPTDFAPKVSTAELRIAQADAQCREESGWAKAVYNAEWERQVATLSQNADSLSAIKRQITSYHKKVLKVVNAHAPVKP